LLLAFVGASSGKVTAVARVVLDPATVQSDEIAMHRLKTGGEYVTSFGSFAHDAAPQI